MAADWNAIRAEYIGGGTSYRKLAEKYNVALRALADHAKAEGWPAARDKARDRSVTLAQRKTADAAAANAVRFERARKAAIDKIIAGIEALPEGATRVQEREYSAADGKLVRLVRTVDYDVNALVASLERLSRIYGYKSDADKREQEARIRQLEQSVGAAQSEPVVIRFEDADAEEAGI